MTGTPRSAAASKIGSISAVWPYRWTGTIAAVFRVIAPTTFAGSMLYDARSMSTNTGLAPQNKTVEAVAKNVRGGGRAFRACGVPGGGGGGGRAGVGVV